MSNIKELKFLCDDCDRLVHYNGNSEQVVPAQSDNAFVFKCAKCNEDGEQIFIHSQKTWIEAASTTIFNLQRIHKRKFFGFSEITAFFEDNWNTLHPPHNHKNSSWTKILSTQLSTSTVFEELEEDEEIFFSLAKSSSSPPAQLPPHSNGGDHHHHHSHHHHHHKKSSSSNHSHHHHKKKHSAKVSSSMISSSPEKNMKDSSSNNNSNSYLWCHQCKQKHDYVLYCTRNCSKKYCTRCVQRHYNEQIEDIEISQWVCYYCQGVCSCASCRRRRAKETNTKFESHRGKKRRGQEDDSTPTKKRKFKPEPISDKEPVESSKDDSNIIETLNNTIEQTSRRKLLRHKSNVPNSPVPDDPIDTPSCRKPMLSSSRRKRVTLKDLIDSNILSSGDELNFRNCDEFAVLLEDGQILWSDITFKSLSTFAKTVAGDGISASSKGALYNGWRVVYCRGKVMDSYRKKYEQRSHKNTDEIEESSDSLENNEREVDENSREEELDPDQESAGGGEPVVVIEDISKEIIIAESQSSMEESSAPIKDSDLFSDKYGNPSSPIGDNPSANPEISPDTWWESDKEEEYDPYNFGSPLFGIFDVNLNPDQLRNPDEEKDILIMGNNVPYLDIGDKDLFNIAEEGAYNTSEGESNNSLLIRSGLNEIVENFYNGFDSDY